jgi:O-antigen ligase/tetratricopeptide (TPR) repeat protein
VRSGAGPTLPLVVLAAVVLAFSSQTLTFDAPKEVLLLLGTAVLVAERLIRDRRAGRSSPPTIDGPTAALLAFAGLLAVAAVRAHDPALAARRLSVFLAGLALFLEARARVREPRDLRRLLVGLALVGVMVAAYGILQKLGRDPFGIPSDGRPVSTLGNPNFAAEILAPLLLATLGLVWAWPALRKPALAGAAILLVHLALTRGRAGWAGLVAGAIAAVGLTLAPRIVSRRRRAALVVATTVLPAVLVLLASVTIESWSGPVRPLVGRTDTIRVRNLIREGTFELLGENPTLGHGLSDFPAEYPRVRPLEEYHLSLQRDVGTPHGDVLEIAVEAGVPAALLLLLAVGLVIRSVVSRLGKDDDPEGDRLTIGALGAVIALLAGGLFSSPLAHPGHLALFFALLGAAAGLRGPEARPLALPAWTPKALRAALVVGLLPGTALAYAHLRTELALVASQRATTPDEVEAAIREAVAWGPGNADARMLEGQLGARKGDDDAARGAYRAILDVQPYHVGARNQLGTLEARAGNWDAALRQYQKALLVNPDYGPAIRNVASLMMRAEEWDKAATLLRRAVDTALEPEAVRPHLIVALAAASRGGEAVDEVKKLVANLDAADRPGDARRAVSWIVRKRPELAPALVRLCERWAEAGRHEEAERLLIGVVAARGAEGDAWTALERIARQKGDADRARAYLARARLAYALEAAREGNVEVAERQLQVATSRGAPAEEVLYVQALVMAKLGKDWEALQLLRKAALAGFRGSDLLQDEPGFDAIRNVSNPVWNEIVDRVRLNDR